MNRHLSCNYKWVSLFLVVLALETSRTENMLGGERMSQDSTQALMEFLGLLGDVSPGVSRSAVGVVSPTRGDIDKLKKTLRNDPAKALANAPSVLGPAPSVERAVALLDEAERALSAPGETLRILSANSARGSHYDLPKPYRFPGYDLVGEEIPIKLDKKKFERKADWPAWVITAVAAWVFRLNHKKPPMPSHTLPQTDFRYKLVNDSGTATLALFSDWGTGYYYSQYIAKHIGTNLNVKQAIHLGDVYYTGRQCEFNKYFTPILEKYLLKKMPFYALNANHEMDSHGIPYFAFLKYKHKKGQTGAICEQPQEGSYFCLWNEHYQVIGIDTAYCENGRHRQGWLQNWLRDQLCRGRDESKVNILLSQNEPYSEKKSKLLRKDLARVAVDERLVDLWFWGDEHYCALYGPSDDAPFFGSCIGHGGYPYSRKSCSDMESQVAPLIWGETAPRFPEDLRVRPGRGNNGFCYLKLVKSQVELTFYDWRLAKRYYRRCQVQDGKLVT